MANYRNIRLLILVLAILALGVIIFILRRYEWSVWLSQMVSKKTPALWFIIFIALLPNFGFPISVFLVLAGAKFGLFGGILITAAAMPFHLLISFLLVHSMLRPGLLALLRKMGYSLPRVPENRVLPFTFLFVLIPGLPYAVKNYTLALTGIPFGYYFGISLPINIFMSLPVIGLGTSAVAMDIRLFVVFAALLIIGYLVVWRLKNNIRKPYI